MTAIQRSARVARTAHDLTHVNRLRVPEFGVVRISVATGAKASKPYRPEGSPAPKEADKGTDDFHFAPEKEDVEIRYEIDDTSKTIDEAKIELFSRFQKDPLWTLDLTTLGPDWYSDGKHVVKWDGRVVTPTAVQAGTEIDEGFSHDLKALAAVTTLDPFPDGYVNLEHTTYKLRLTVKGGGESGRPAVSWTYFHVLVQKIELEYGPTEVLPQPVADRGDHRAVLAALIVQDPKPPAATAANPVKVFLESDVYKTDANQMFNNTLHDAYETLWGEGPQIPIFAKVTIQKSDDTGIDAPKAIGNVRFLWDWESKSAARATGRHGDAFVNDAQDYLKDKSKPKGQNCHKDRSGKRGTTQHDVFPASAGYAPADSLTDGTFPFKVEAVPDKRKWSVYSFAWRQKALAGKTGVVFQPSRMAGDVWSVCVYLAWDVDKKGKAKLDVDTDAPLAVAEPTKTKAASGTFEVWRRVHFRKYLRKRQAGTPAVAIATMLGNFTDAFIDAKDESGAGNVFGAGDWNTAVTGAMAAWGAVDKLVVDDPVNQHTAGPEGLVCRGRVRFITAWKKKNIKDDLVDINVPAADAGQIADAAGAEASAAVAETTAKSEAATLGYGAVDQTNIGDATKAAWNYVASYVANAANGMDTEANYAKWLEGKAIGVLQTVFDARFAAGNGVTIFQVERSHNFVHLQTKATIGLAHDFNNANLNRCAFLLMCPNGAAACGLEKISAHEIGHHFYLPHPTDTAEKKNYKAHDKVVPSKCLMSYNYTLEMNLCGFCQLRLRGWNKRKLDPDGTKNKKT